MNDMNFIDDFANKNAKDAVYHERFSNRAVLVS